jgi:hypothetical protein
LLKTIFDFAFPDFLGFLLGFFGICWNLLGFSDFFGGFLGIQIQKNPLFLPCQINENKNSSFCFTTTAHSKKEGGWVFFE